MEDIGYFDDINDERDKIATDTLPSEDREIQKEVDKSFPSLESTYLFDEKEEEDRCIPYINNEEHCIRATRKINFEETPKGYNKISLNNNQSNIKLQQKLEDFKLSKRKQFIGYKSQRIYGICT